MLAKLTSLIPRTVCSSSRSTITTATSRCRSKCSKIVGLIRITAGVFGANTITGDMLATTVRLRAISNGIDNFCPNDDTAAAGAGKPVPSIHAGVSVTVGAPNPFGVNCITHDVLASGARHVVTITGHGFNFAAASVTVSGTGVSASSIKVISSTQISAFMTVTSPGDGGSVFRDITISNGGRTFVCRSCMRIGPAPTAFNVSPQGIGRGAVNQVLKIFGNYSDLARWRRSPVSPSSATHLVSFQELDLNVTVPGGTPVGTKTLDLYDPYYDGYGYYGHSTCTKCVSVT